MKPQNLFDQKIKAVIRSGIQQGDDQPHAFSVEYEQKKQEILQQAQRKSIRVTSRSKRRIGIAAIAVAVAAAIPTSVYAANLVRSTTRVERSGQYAADLVVQPQTEQSTTDSTQQLGAQPLEDMGPVKINLSYIPDSFVKGEQGKLTYFNPETPYQGGISVFLWKLEGDDSEFRMAMRSAVDSEELHFNDNVGLYMQRNTVAKNDSIQMDKDALLHIGNSQYVVEVFGGEDLSKEEMLKVVEGISLTPVADASQADPADVYQAPQEEVRADAGVAESDKLRFDKDDITGVYQIGDTHQEQVVQFESGGPDLPVDVTISNIRIQDNFDGLDSGEINGPSDYASYLDADGNLVPNVRTYYEPGDGVNTVDTAIGTKEFQQKIIVADITYTNHTDQVADSICVCPSLFFLQEDKDSYVEYTLLYDTIASRISIDEVEAKDGKLRLMKNVWWEYDKLPHMLIAGGTGGGKTYFILTLIEALLHTDSKLYILDPKNADLADLGSVMANVYYRKEDLLSCIETFYEEMMKRSEDMKLMENYRTGENYAYLGLPANFLIFDEYVAFMEMLGTKENAAVLNKLKQIVMLGRQAGFFLILACQRPDAKYLGDGIRDQFNFRVALGRMSEMGYGMMFGETTKDFFLKQIKGRGYVDVGTSVISEFYTPLVPKGHDFLKEIKKLTDSRQGVQAACEAKAAETD